MRVAATIELECDEEKALRLARSNTTSVWAGTPGVH